MLVNSRHVYVIKYDRRTPNGLGRTIFRWIRVHFRSGGGEEGKRGGERSIYGGGWRSSPPREANRFRGLKYFLPDWSPRDFSSIDGKSSVWSAVFYFLTVHRPRWHLLRRVAAVRGGLCRRNLDRRVILYRLLLARGLSHAPLLFVRRRSGSRDINFLLLPFYRVLSPKIKANKMARGFLSHPFIIHQLQFDHRIVSSMLSHPIDNDDLLLDGGSPPTRASSRVY